MKTKTIFKIQKKYILKVALLPVFVFTLLLASIYLTSSPDSLVQAAVNDELNYQARLLKPAGDLVLDGDYSLEFKLYNASTSSGSSQGSCAGDTNCLWTETYTGGNVVRVVNGYITVNLGSITTFPSTIDWSQELWLTLNVGGIGGPTWDGEMTPRTKVTAIPFAFVAGSAQAVSTPDTNAVSTNSNNATISTGDAAGATSNSGNITLDVGTATGTTGTVSLGAANASALYIGNATGALTVTGSSGSSFIFGGTTVTAAEFNVLDAGIEAGDLTTQGTATDEFCLTYESTAGALLEWQACGGGGGGGVTSLRSLTGALSLNGTTNEIEVTDNTSDTITIGLPDDVTIGGTLTVTTELNVASSALVANASGVTLAVDTTVAAGKSLTLIGGNTASRPDPTTQEGEIYYDSETNQVLISDGTSWKLVSGKSSATYVVAASDSVRPELADYLADGTSDEDDINSAITAANTAGGGTVYLMEGTYEIDATILMLSDVALVGSGNGTKIVLTAGTNPAADDLIGNAGTIYNAEIRSLTVDANSDGPNTGNLTGIDINAGAPASGTQQRGVVIDSVSVIDTTSTNIDIGGSDYSSVTNSYIQCTSAAWSDYAIDISASTTVHIGNNDINNCGVLYAASTTDSVITNNTLTEMVTTPSIGIIHVSGTNNSIISNNLNGSTGGGSAIYSSSTGASNSIVGNSVVDITGDGIRASGSNTTISGNSVDTVSGDGLLLGGSQLSVTGNTVRNSTRGVDGSFLNQSTISSNVFADNTSDGLYLANSATNSYNTISNNVFRGNQNHIYFWTGSHHNIIDGNMFTENPGTGSEPVRNNLGVWLRGSTDNTVSNNTFYDLGQSTTNGSIDLESNADDNTIVNNKIYDSSGTGDGIEISSDSDNTFIGGNTFSGTYAEEIDDDASTTIYSGQVDSSDNLVLQAPSAGGLNLISGTGDINLQVVDSATTGVIQIGAGGAGTTTPDFLGLDVKSTTGDPAGGAEGYIYYNTADNKFRCYEGAAWTDCIGAGGGGGVTTLNSLTGALSILGTTNEIEVNTSTPNITIGLPDDVTIGNTLTVTGLTTLNGGLTVQDTDTFTFGGLAYTDFEGTGLTRIGTQLAVDATTSNGFFQNGGNNFGGNATIGTTQAGQSLIVETAGSTALTIDGNQLIGIGASPVASAQLYIAGTAPNEVNGTALRISSTLNSSTNYQSGIRSGPVVSPGAASTQWYAGIYGLPETSSSNVTSATLLGVGGDPYVSGSASLASIIGVSGAPQNAGTGTIASAIGLRSQIVNSSTGTITSAYGISVVTPSNPSGTITNGYGIYISDVLGSTLQYGIYQDGATDSNLFNGATAINNTLTVKPTAVNTAALSVQGSTSQEFFTVDTTNDAVEIGNGTDDVVLSLDAFNTDPTSVPDGSMFYDADDDVFRCRVSGSWVNCDTGGGGGGSTRITFVPEFAGGLLSADGSANNGTMISDYDSTNRHNYYQWTTAQATAQDYDIIIRQQLPSNVNATTEFDASSWKLWTYRDNATNGSVTVYVYDDDGTACANGVSGSTSTGWQQVTLTDFDTNASCDFTANSMITVRLVVQSQSPSTDKVRVGEIEYSYTP